MNQKPSGARAGAQQRDRAGTRYALGEPTPEEIEAWQRIRDELSKTRREAKIPVEPNPADLWACRTEWLLNELDGVREMILLHPARPETRSDLQSAIDRIWRLEQDVRFILCIQREGQRAFAKAGETQKRVKRQRSKTTNDQKIINITAH